jgi:gliding-associated putative ABC transporter substrate-binding component GldG
MKNLTSILLICGIVLLINVLSRQLFFRLDLTENKEYTMSQATKDILKNLDDPVTVTGYFSGDLPPVLDRMKSDFQELLVEYSNISKGNVEFEFVNPDESEELKTEAAQNGIAAVPVQVREKDQIQVKNTFMGAILQYGETKEVLPALQPGAPLEYTVTTAIKKISVQNKSAVGLVQGHGEPQLQQLQEVYQALSILYNVEPLDLSTEANIPPRFKTVAIVAPTDSFTIDELQKLDNYLAQGGNLFLAVNRAEGDFQTSQITAKTTGLEGWLQNKGIELENNILVDANCGQVSVRQQQGFMTFNSVKQFPYFPNISTFEEHPITQGLEQVVMPIASSMRFSGDSSVAFTPIAFTSENTGSLNLPNFFDIIKQWTNADFGLSNMIVGGVLQGNISGNVPSRIVIFSDGDFPSQGQGRGQSNNASLMTNSIDWLSDDTGLIELRTKAVATRPIKDLEDAERSMWKYINFLLPIILVIVYGIFRNQRQRNLRIKRMQESYV